MIVTIRTGPHSSAQGELVRLEMTSERSECGLWVVPGEYTGRATINAGGVEVTGEIILRKEK